MANDRTRKSAPLSPSEWRAKKKRVLKHRYKGHLQLKLKHTNVTVEILQELIAEGHS